jgi:hypothetical protein
MNSIDPTERLGRQMARLNTTHVKFDIGSGGGVPELTAQDIAAAVGMVPDGLGRELLIHVHWPDGAKYNRATLLELMTLTQLGEHNRREQEVARALCQVAVATPASRAGAARAYSDAHLNRWPLWVTKIDTLTLTKAYENICLGILEELRHPRHCPECNGREERDRVGNVKVCDRCVGTGNVVYGSTWRAARLGMKRAAFIESWKGPYDWLMDACHQSLLGAETGLMKALR